MLKDWRAPLLVLGCCSLLVVAWHLLGRPERVSTQQVACGIASLAIKVRVVAEAGGAPVPGARVLLDRGKSVALGSEPVGVGEGTTDPEGVALLQVRALFCSTSTDGSQGRTDFEGLPTHVAVEAPGYRTYAAALDLDARAEKDQLDLGTLALLSE